MTDFNSSCLLEANLVAYLNILRNNFDDFEIIK